MDAVTEEKKITWLYWSAQKDSDIILRIKKAKQNEEIIEKKSKI